MGGIAGWIDREVVPIGPGVIGAMTTAIAHRGPDGTGRWDGVVRSGKWRLSLGHRRLAVIDQEGGAQPTVSANSRAILVFNGKIYNSQELRAELAARGEVFTTQSDTEILLAAYGAWGADCVQHLRGMFAFALWDATRERLFMARDRFGKKPLYLWQDGEGAVVFGSEVKALLAHPRVPALLDRASVAEYLAWGYVPGPNTLFAGIRKLPPASWAMWENGQLTEASYWAPPDAGDRAVHTIPKDPIGEFTRLLEDCVRVRMVSDVPFGAFLSGGLDSSAVVALMNRHSDRPINTFSVGDGSELKYARMVAEQFHTNHHELVIAADDVIADLPQLTVCRDAPVSEPADMAIHRLSKLAQQSVKMVLTGGGADELLGGYPKYRAEPLVAMYQRMVPGMVQRHLTELLPCQFRRMGLRDPRERLPAWFGALSPTEAAKLLSLAVPKRILDPRPFRVAKRQTPLRRALHFDQTSWLPDNLLERDDRMTMAVGIEARMPFMDHLLANYCSKLPDNYRVRGISGKWLLRQSMAPLLPNAVLHRPKTGFRVPVDLWFRDKLRGWVTDLLLGPHSATRDWYRIDRLARLVNDHVSGRHNHEKALWMLVVLELFQRQYQLK